MEQKKIRKQILLIGGGFLLAGLAYYLVIQLTGWSLPCNLYSLTGVQCATCGLTRMFTSMAKLDFAAAFHYNPVCFCLVWMWSGYLALLYIGKPKWIKHIAPFAVLMGVTTASLVFFGIYRATIPFL